MIAIKLFGVMRDIVGKPMLDIDEQVTTVAALKEVVEQKYPKAKALNSLLVAVNSEYAADEQTITATDEVALIPPVSGG